MRDESDQGRSQWLVERRAVLLGMILAPMAGNAMKTEEGTPWNAMLRKRFEAYDGKTAEQKLAELFDREEIRELISRYAQRVAQGISVADLFTEADDSSFIVRYPGRTPTISRGRAGLAKTYTAVAGADDRPLPMIHNHVLEIRGDDAIGICSNELRWREGEVAMIGSGYYLDRFRREKGRWTFVERDMHFIHWVPLKEGWVTAKTAA